MKILVTGANGFLGSWILKRLIGEGHQVRVLLREKSDCTLIKDLNFEKVHGDVTDESSVYDACSGMEVVFHVAGLVSYSPADYSLMEKVNVGGTKNIVNACLKSKVSRLIHTSSVVAVGASTLPEILNEESPFKLHKYNLGYFETKRRAEEEIFKGIKKGGIEAIIVNPGVMFGAGDALKSSRKTHLKVARGQFPFYPPGGVNILHVEDAVIGHLSAMNKGKVGDRYILGGENVRTFELFKMISEFTGKKPPTIPVPKALLKSAFYFSKIKDFSKSSETFLISTLFHWYDSSKAKKDLGFQPRPAIQGIHESLTWAKDNGYLKP